MQSGEDSLWESFPRILKSQEGGRRYINAFRAPFQEIPFPTPQQMNTLWVCSLLVIPPPIGRMVPQGGFPSDLTKLNLSGWADLVQDMAAGLQALPPSDCLTPAARGSNRSRVLSPLLPPKTPLYVYGSLTVSSLHVVKLDCSADPGIWSDLHLWRSN